MIYSRAYAWSLCNIFRVVLTQRTTISAALDCVTWGEIRNTLYDGGLLARPDVTPAMGQLRARRWFWALMSWEFFLAKQTFHQVMLTFRMPKDPPLEISCPEVVMDNLAYDTGSFGGFVIEDIDYATWFLASSAGPIIDDCLVSGGRVLGGITRARRALEACLG